MPVITPWTRFASWKERECTGAARSSQGMLVISSMQQAILYLDWLELTSEPEV